MLSKISSIKETVKELKNRLTQPEQDLIYYAAVGITINLFKTNTFPIPKTPSISIPKTITTVSYF